MHRIRRVTSGALCAILIAMGLVLVTGPTRASAAADVSTDFRWGWIVTDLEPPGTADQAVEGRVSGVSDAHKNAGFALRKTGANTFVLVNLSGTRYQVFVVRGGRWSRAVDVPFTHEPDGTFRAEVAGSTVRAFWNGALIDEQEVPAAGPLTGTGAGVAIWQDAARSVQVSVDGIDAVTGGFSTGEAWRWVVGPDLAETRSAEQFVQARISGNTDEHKNGALVLRKDDAGFVMVNFSGTRYQVFVVRDGAWATAVDEPFAPGGAGVARAEISGRTVTASWNGTTVDTSTVPAVEGMTGTGTALSVWQNEENAVSLTDAVSGDRGGEALLPPPTSTTAPTPTPDPSPTSTQPTTTQPTTTAPTTTAPTSTGPTGTSTSTAAARQPVGGLPAGQWYSGAASPYAANGSFGSWRGESITAGGTWVNGNTQMISLDTIQPGAEWGSWSGVLDLAVGAIDYTVGESWGAAASGAYDARWIQSAKNINSVWTGRGKPAGNLYVRFAHEMNGNWFPWRVQEGQEADFRAAWVRWAKIMRQYAPGTHLVWSVNKNRSPGMARSIDLWPGSEWVDVYSLDWYNVWPYCASASCLDSEFTRMDGADPIGPEMHRRQAEKYGVPFAISEWSNSAPTYAGQAGGGGEMPEFMTYINAWFRKNAGSGSGQVLYEVLFNLWNRYALYGSEAQQPVTAARYQALVWGK